MAVRYSQNLEQDIILDYFGSFKGTLLSLGENNGETFSNSRALVLDGWEAHLIEPSFAYIPLNELYRGNDKVTCYNIGISTKTEVTTFYELSDSLLATTNKELADKWGFAYSERQVKMMAFNEFISRIQVYHFDFITSDVEGLDYSVLQQMDLASLGCKCLCIEYWKHEKEIIEYCKYFGLHLIYKNGENLILAQ